VLRRFAYPTWTGSKSLSPARRARKQSAELLDFPGVAKEQFAHRETEELLTMLDGVAAKAGSRGEVFSDFLTMTVCTLAGGTMEEEYLATVQKYVEGEKGKRPIDQLAAAFARLITIMDDTREDILGDLFQGGITYGEHAQYFTPAPICDLMAQVTAGDEPGLGRTFCDPCCGSGRMLLAMAKLKSYGLFVGQDADLRCVKITAINLALHNLYGHAIWGNSLSNERKLVYETGFNGKGVIRKLADEEFRTIPTVEPPPSPPESLASTEPDGKTSQGSLFDGL
jgi:N-6 DNA Methylase